MLRSPWDDRLWSSLSATPYRVVDSHVINQNLTDRKSFRLKLEGSGKGDDPLLLAPPSGEWSGEYQDMPCVANEEHSVKYSITFRADGAILGSGSCKEGEFKIKGVFSLSTGIVAWCQFPYQPRPNAKSTEFYGDISNFASGPARITGTFLTCTGRYCTVNLVHPKVSESKEDAVSPTISLPPALPTLQKGSMTPKREWNASSTALPTLLSGSMTPIKDGKPAFFFRLKN